MAGLIKDKTAPTTMGTIPRLPFRKKGEAQRVRDFLRFEQGKTCQIRKRYVKILV
jgi:hypothetical protein